LTFSQDDIAPLIRAHIRAFPSLCCVREYSSLTLPLTLFSTLSLTGWNGMTVPGEDGLEDSITWKQEKVTTCSERACAGYIWLPSSSEANENPLCKVCTLNQALIRELAQNEDVYYGSDNRVQVELTTLLSIKNLRITWQHAEQELREHKNVLLRLSSKQHVNPAMTLDEAKMLKRRQSEKLVEILEIHQKNPDVFQVISHLCLSTFLYLMDARVLY